jgi:phosphate:Na+ symporter
MTIKDLETKAISMVDKVLKMLELIDRGFMENKSEFLSGALREESDINDLEKSTTRDVLELSRSVKKESEKKALSRLEQVVETLERMGDEATDLIERIEIKIAEHLMFSETGVEQFNETYSTMKRSVEMMKEFLKNRDPVLKEKVIDNGFHVKELVERYRKEHTERLVKGICTPMAANMYFDMLDFTGNLARHSSNIVKLF